MGRTVEISDAAEDLDKLIDEVSSGGGPIALTRRANVVAVLISHERYDELAGADLRRAQREARGEIVDDAEVTASDHEAGALAGERAQVADSQMPAETLDESRQRGRQRQTNV